ncbi:MAG: 16S rRNA (guanine(966)-N(2))-methyltransferase RsmD [Syntrophaceae bacterium]|nr:16S rRNA (guanine(966)-N(2))-methyltransferase RsmD [Syntrophaceae bacterium]
MRVIGGISRGKRLFVPKGSRARPTSDRIREALFNILQDVRGFAFLDLYAGSGAVGIEALSRGAARAVFVEQDPRMAECLRRNVRDCGYDGAAEILETDASDGVRRLSRRGERFHLVFADPPYAGNRVGEILKETAEWPLLDGEGLLVIQHSAREELTEPAAEIWRCSDRRRYGDTMISFYELTARGENYA